MRRLGATPEQIAKAQAKLAAEGGPAQEHYGVWAENWDTFLFFCSLETQWERELWTVTTNGPMGASHSHTQARRVCLPSDRVESHLRIQGIPRRLWSAMFADVQRMEIAVLEADQAQREAQAASQ